MSESGTRSRNLIPPPPSVTSLTRALPSLSLSLLWKRSWEVIDNAAPFEVLGMEILPLPVHHGGTYVCLGFSFGNGSFVYLSDVSEVQPHILETLKSFDIELLVLDCLDR